ncbi:MAG: hypothetical protein J1F43_03445 [Muribaculaceae bacterium]|nr:hypothetical protein [Muribaculaceae bacterium]
MKKSLLLSAVALAALTAKAEVVDYDFNTNPAFFTLLYSEEYEYGPWSGEYDLIDKYGMDVNTSGTMFCEKDLEGNWVAIPNYAIDLVDGQTYNLKADDMEELDYSHPFLCWDQDGVGPSRVHYFNGWNNTEVYEDKDYGAASEDDFIASKGALGFLRQGNNAARTGTWVQFPEFKDPAKVTVWMCNQGGDYHEKGLYCEITPVINGEALEAIPVEGPSDYVAKRYYKVETTLPATVKGNVALRVGCGGSQVQLVHVSIASADEAGIEGIIMDADNANAPVYNMFGVKVDDSYKGVVIKNGKKFIRK